MPTATAKPTAPEIVKAIHSIQSGLGNIAKSGTAPAQMGGYKFLSVDDVIGAVRPLMNENNVIMTVSLTDLRTEFTHGHQDTTGRVGKTNTHVFVTYEFTFTSAIDGSSVSTTVVGEGLDGQDKGTRKATTSAQNIALIETFFIQTGEPDEHDGQNGADAVDSTPAKPISQAQQRAQAAAKPAASDEKSAEGKAAQAWIAEQINSNAIPREKVMVITNKVAGPEGLNLPIGHPDVLIAVKPLVEAKIAEG